jgi:amino acid efflux transporter
MLLGAVLGPGALALPTLAADAAGPASLLAWALLLAASVPVAATFAALGSAHPDGGGVAHFAALAFSRRVAAPVGWWFLAAVPLGVTAAALMGGHYVAAALGAGPGAAMGVGFGLLAVSFVLNAAGLHATGRVQVLTTAVMVTLLVVTVSVSLGDVRPGSFTPFAPQGWGSVGTAATVLFFAFAGWEAATHLSADFADPGRGLRRATALTLCLVVTLYLGLAVVTVGVLGPAAGSTPAPLLTLLQDAFGPTGTVLATAAAVLLTFGAINAYLAGGARLAATLGRDRSLPRRLVGRTIPGQEPRRSLAFLATACLLVAVPVLGGAMTLDALVRATSALLAAVTLTGTLAGVRLLRGRQRRDAVVASAFVGVVLVLCGPLLLVPAVVGGAALLVPRAGRTCDDPTGAVSLRDEGPDALRRQLRVEGTVRHDHPVVRGERPVGVRHPGRERAGTRALHAEREVGP